jgi:hypothetical protein
MFHPADALLSTPGSRRRGGPLPLRVIWYEVRDDLREVCNGAAASPEVPDADSRSPSKSFSHAA